LTTVFAARTTAISSPALFVIFRETQGFTKIHRKRRECTQTRTDANKRNKQKRGKTRSTQNHNQKVEGGLTPGRGTLSEQRTKPIQNIMAVEKKKHRRRKHLNNNLIPPFGCVPVRYHELVYNIGQEQVDRLADLSAR
jgi:hypothetical protein